MGILTAGIVFVAIFIASTVLRRRRSRRAANGDAVSRIAVLGTIAIGILIIVGLVLLIHHF